MSQENLRNIKILIISDRRHYFWISIQIKLATNFFRSNRSKIIKMIPKCFRSKDRFSRVSLTYPALENHLLFNLNRLNLIISEFWALVMCHHHQIKKLKIDIEDNQEHKVILQKMLTSSKIEGLIFYNKISPYWTFLHLLMCAVGTCLLKKQKLRIWKLWRRERLSQKRMSVIFLALMLLLELRTLWSKKIKSNHTNLRLLTK